MLLDQVFRELGKNNEECAEAFDRLTCERIVCRRILLRLYKRLHVCALTIQRIKSKRLVGKRRERDLMKYAEKILKMKCHCIMICDYKISISFIDFCSRLLDVMKAVPVDKVCLNLVVLL
ncbi:unnamed protein product [Cylicocyclus nassatus]|uniref:Uncharacterized protein n=1 Tax=Cylicocyclus nassatus TaxID=53992 RepID=A0AA36GUE8_CYLNA|nr:unnamed protein product [Cylicocyclus nassatus]